MLPVEPWGSLALEPPEDVLRGLPSDAPLVKQFVASRASRDPAPTGGNEHLLLVEDETALRVATARILEAQGFKVTTAADGVEALEIIERLRGEIDLVLTDVAMPRMRGDQLARRLSETYPALAVVFMSGYDSGEAKLPGRLINKPVSAELLLRTVREALAG